MPPLATLGDNLIDDLVPVIDEVRQDVNTDLGIKPWRVFLVRRQWSGVEVGDGEITGEVAVEILPQPEVLVPGLFIQLNATGLVEDGNIELQEISLTFAESELQPRDVQANEEFFYRLVAALGQGQVTRHYVPAKPPEADRTGERGFGWVVALKRAQLVEGQ